MRGFLIFLLITVAFTENLIQFHGDESSNWSYDLSGIGMTKSSPSLDIKKLQSHLLTCLLAGINGHSCVFLGDDDVTRRNLLNDVPFQGINNLLKNVQLNIAGPFSTTFTGGSAGAKDIVCSNIQISDMTISSSEHLDLSEIDIEVKINGLSIQCTMTWFYTVVVIGSDQGGVSASVSNGNADITMSFKASNLNLAPVSGVGVNTCSSSITLGDIKVSGSSFSSKYILPYIVPLLTGTIQTQLNNQICSLLESQFNANVPQLLTEYDAWAAPLIQPLPPPPSVSDLEKAALDSLPPGSTLLKWNELAALQYIRTNILDPLQNSDPNDPNSLLFKVNGYITQYVGKGGLDLGINYELFNTTNSLMDASVKVVSVKIQGLDSLKKVQLLNKVPDSDYTLNSLINWGEISIEAVLAVDLSTTGPSGTSISSSNVNVDVTLSNITISLEAVIGVNPGSVMTTKIGSLMNNVLDCSLLSVPAIDVVRIGLNLGNIAGPTITGMIDSGFNGIVNDLINDLSLAQKNVFLMMIPQLVDHYLLPMVNTQLTSFLNGQRNGCAVYQPPITTASCFPSLPLKSSSLFAMARSKLESLLTYGGGLDFAKLMQLFIPTTVLPYNYVPGSWGPIGSEQSPIGTYQINVGPIGNINVVFTTLQMNGLDQFDKVIVLEPLTDSLLHVEAFVGWRPEAVDHLNFTLGNVKVWIDGPSSHLYDLMDISVNVNDFHIALNLTTDFNEASILNTSIGTVINKAVCLVRSMQYWGFDELTATIGRGNLNIDCKRCTSPGLLPVIQRLKKIEDLSSLVSFINFALDRTGILGKGELRHLMNWLDGIVFNAVNNLMGQNVQYPCPDEMGPYQPAQGMWNPISLMVPKGAPAGPAPSKGVCQLDPTPDPNAAPDPNAPSPVPTAAPAQPVPSAFSIDWGKYPGVEIIFYGVGIVNIFLLLAYFIYVCRRCYSKGPLNENDYSGLPLCFHPSVNIIVRIIMPIVLIGLLFLFYSAHTQTGASFDVFIEFAGEEIKLDKFYSITLANTVQQALQAGSYSLAVLVGLLSGVWPYVKVELMIFCWITPPRFFGKVERGSLLNTLDTLGKWSQVDLYVLVLLMVAFNLRIDTPVGFNGAFDQGFISAHMQLDPNWGLFGFVLAVMIAILSNQVIVWYNRKCIRDYHSAQTRKKTINETIDPTNRSAALFGHHFETKDGMNYIQYGTGGVFLITSLILMCGGFMIWGSVSNSLGFKYEGLIAAGLSWAYGTNASAPDYSIITMTSVLDRQEGVNPYGILFLQGSIYFFTLIAPLLYTCILFILWAFRMTVTTQEKMLYIAEIVKDWCCLDVFVVAYIVTLLEVGHLADYIGGLAGTVCSYFSAIALGGDDLGCFAMSAYPEMPGIPVICSSVVLLWILQVIIINGTKEAVHDREPDEHFNKGHKPSSAFTDLLLERQKPTPGFLIGKMLPNFIVKVGKIAIGSNGSRRYTSFTGSEDSLGSFITRRLSVSTSANRLVSGSASENADTTENGDVHAKFNKPKMKFERPGFVFGSGTKTGSSRFRSATGSQLETIEDDNVMSSPLIHSNSADNVKSKPLSKSEDGIDPSRRLSKLDEAAEEKLQRKSMKKPNNKIVSSNYEKLEDDEV